MKDIKITINLPMMSYPFDLVLEDEIWIHEVQL